MGRKRGPLQERRREGDSSARKDSSNLKRNHIERPLDLAEFLLQDQGRTRQKILEEIRLVQEKRIGVTEPVPVNILLWTAWVDNHGAVNFSTDLYQRDPRVAAALRARPHLL